MRYFVLLIILTIVAIVLSVLALFVYACIYLAGEISRKEKEIYEKRQKRCK